MLEGNATPTATQSFFEGKGIDASKQRLFDGLKLSALGAGTYLGAADDATDQLYEESLLQAPSFGINCFDTSINYRGQRSEKVLGKILKQFEREQMFISTKGGFLGVNEVELFEKKVIEAKDIAAECHCMTPSFLDNQIETSLGNLGLGSIDLYYLHNPEIELLEWGEAEFYRRLEAAFQRLEQKVQEKKICRYGIATWNGFRQKAKSKGVLNLAKIVECAKKCGGDEHHFKAIQLPFNLVMLEALKVANQEGDKTIFDAAKELNIGVMASASLMQGQIRGIAKRTFDKLPPATSLYAQAIDFVLSTPAVLVGYVGMKQRSHLEENGQLLAKPVWKKEEWIASCSALGLKFSE